MSQGGMEGPNFKHHGEYLTLRRLGVVAMQILGKEYLTLRTKSQHERSKARD